MRGVPPGSCAEGTHCWIRTVLDKDRMSGSPDKAHRPSCAAINARFMDVLSPYLRCCARAPHRWSPVILNSFRPMRRRR